MNRRGNKSGTPLVPERIGRYDVLLPIASGGMGTVYLSRSRGVGGFQREVALKVMHAHLREEEHFATDLIEEAKLAVRIQHANVVQVLDVGEDPHGVFLVMEYIEGDSLAGLQRARRKLDESIPIRIGVRILVDALLGLHAAHELRDEAGVPLNLVHRDFSPQNILVGVDGISRLTDFGVAKASTRLSHTATGLVKGKIHYMSPEQARTDPIDRRCDVWAGGVMVWETLAGKRLYPDRGEAAILLKLITEPPPRLRTVRRDIPQALEDVVAHALATDTRKRCPSARAFADALLAAAEAHEGVADHAEVAAFLEQTAGESLRTRRAQVVEVVKLRDEINTIARASTVDESDLTTSPAEGHHLVALEAATARDEEPTQVTHSTHSASPPASAGGRSKPLVLALAAVAVTAVATYVLSRPPAVEPSPQPAVANEASSTPATPPASAAPTPAPSSRDAAATITVAGNAPIQLVKIGARSVVVSPPRNRIAIELESGERGRPLLVSARATDGRSAATTLAPESTEAKVEFPARVVTAPHSTPNPAVPHPAVPHPAVPHPAVPHSTAAPLATNPHQ